jgi:gliding motility-associated-like protein
MNFLSDQFIHSKNFLKCFFFKRRILFVFFFLSFLENFAQTQGLCTQGVGTERGAFSVSSSAICSGQTVTITDASGGSNVSYYFGYEGTETQAQLTAGATTATTSTPLLAGTLQVYTILQIGKKNGKDMYACRNVTVRPDSKPVFSYSICNDRVEIVIPQNPLNDFDSYQVLYGTNIDNINPLDLPYEKNIQIPRNRSIKVEGFYTNGNNCPRPNMIVIPTYTPTNFPNGYEQPNFASIESIELLDKKTASISIRGSYIDSGYNLHKTELGKDYDYSNPIKSNVHPGILQIHLDDTTKIFCFQLSRQIANCGNEFSAELCTNLINEIKPIGKQNEINWIVYPTQMTGIANAPLFGRYLLSKHQLEISEPSRTVLLAQNLGTYTDQNFSCSTNQCYQIVTETSGQIFYNKFKGKSTSNKVCISRKNFHPPALTDASITVTNAQKNSISFQDNSGWALNKEVFRINRSDQPNAAFIAIDSTTNNSDTRTDASAMPETTSYCYQIDYRDECGSISEPSPTFCSLHLSEQTNGTIAWTAESPFADSFLDAYEVFRYDEQTNAATSEASYRPAITHEHTPDYTNFQDYATFRVKSTSAIGKESWSNLLKIPLEPKIFLPTAFSPNQDGINDELVLQGNFGRITTFSFTILNRWGETIFTSNSLNEAWDGTLGGKPAPEGYYFYQIKAITNTNEIINKKGQIVLLR